MKPDSAANSGITDPANFPGTICHLAAFVLDNTTRKGKLEMAQPRILVAEDEAIVACDLIDTVEEAGYFVEGPHRDISSAMLAFQKQKPDLAILDVQLGDGVVYPLARKLAEEHIPIIFHTGNHSPHEIISQFPQSQALAKPCPPADILGAVTEALQTH